MAEKPRDLFKGRRLEQVAEWILQQMPRFIFTSIESKLNSGIRSLINEGTQEFILTIESFDATFQYVLLSNYNKHGKKMVVVRLMNKIFTRRSNIKQVGTATRKKFDSKALNKIKKDLKAKEERIFGTIKGEKVEAFPSTVVIRGKVKPILRNAQGMFVKRIEDDEE